METIQSIRKHVHWLMLDLDGIDKLDQPTDSNLGMASYYSKKTVDIFQAFQFYMRAPYPEHPELSSLVDQVFQILRDEHGGMLPHELFDTWRRKRSEVIRSDDRKLYTPQERKTLAKVWERWSDEEKVRNEFWGVWPMENLSTPLSVYPREGEIRKMGKFMRHWLQKQRSGETGAKQD